MKKIILSFLLLAICIKCLAQTKLTPGEIKGKYDTFIIHELRPLSNGQKTLVIYSKSNKYNKGIPYTKAEKDHTFLPMNFRKDLHVNKDAIKQIVYNVLNNELNALKNNKETMSVLINGK